MSTDPKIDLFSKDLFNALWKHHGFITAEPREHPPTEFNQNIFRAVQTRQAMFHSAYEAIFENTHVEFAGNSSYFFDAIVDFFPHYLNEEDPEEESVMCMFLSSCAFVAVMCMLSRSRGDDLLDAGREAWAMFADLHLSEAFYAAGGWKELQFFVRCDLAVYDYMRTFSDVIDCDLGKNVMFHSAHLTCAAVESFNECEDWVGVDQDAPYALKWVDFCVQLPFVEIRSPDYYSEPIPSVFDKLESIIWSLSYICEPLEEEDLFDEDFDATNQTKTGCTGRYFRKILGLDGELERENCSISKETSSGLQSTSSGQSFDKKDSNIGNFEQVLFRKESPSYEEQSDSKVLKTENEASFLYNKNISPADNPSLESKVEGALSGLLSHETSTPNDSSYFCSANDHDDTQPKMYTNPEDFHTCVDHFTRKKFSDHKSRVKVFVKTIHHDNATDSDEGVEKSPKLGFLSPRKSPLTSPTINVLNTPDRTLFRRMNSTGSDGMKRKSSTGKENSPSSKPKTNTKNNTLYQKYITVTNSPNLGIEANDRKLKENKCTKGDTFSPDLLPISSCETSLSIDQSLQIPKFISLPKNPFLIKEETNPCKYDRDQSLPGNDNEVLCLDKSGVKTSERIKWLELNRINNQTNFSLLLDEMTSKPTTEQSMTENVDKADTINVLAHKNSFTDSHFESLPKISVCEDLNSLRCRTAKEKSPSTQFVQTSSCLKVPHQNSVLIDDDENYHILEKPLKIFEPEGKNDVARPVTEKEYESSDSQDSSSTEIYEVTQDEKSSADPTEEKQLQSPESKSPLETKLYYGKLLGKSGYQIPSVKPTNENPIGFEGKNKETEKKSKKGLNSNDSNRETLQTTQNTTSETVLENPDVGFSSKPQDMEKKGKKKRHRKHLTRLEQRVREEGDAVHDVTRLIFVMGHRPGMASVASAFHDSKKTNL